MFQSQSLLYCQFCHMYRTYIQRIEIALLSDPWCIQITLKVERKNTDKYKSNIYIYIHTYTHTHIECHYYNIQIRTCKNDMGGQSSVVHGVREGRGG